MNRNPDAAGRPLRHVRKEWGGGGTPPAPDLERRKSAMATPLPAIRASGGGAQGKSREEEASFDEKGGAKRPGRVSSLFRHAKSIGSEAHQAILNEHQGVVDGELAEFDAEAKEAAALVDITFTGNASKITLKKEAKRQADRKAVVDQKRAALKRRLEAAKAERIRVYMVSVPKWRSAAIEKEKVMLARATHKKWIRKIQDAERTFGPFAMPRTREQVTTALEVLPGDSPYEGVFLFMLALLRMKTGSLKSARNRLLSQEFMCDALHSDCVLLGEPRKIRKHTRQALTNACGDVARSYFDGTSPLNQYGCDMEKLTMTFKLLLGYANVEGASCEILIQLSGVEPGRTPFRAVEMAYERDRWRVRSFSNLLMPVVDPFEEEPGDENELAREAEYRKAMDLPPRPNYKPVGSTVNAIPLEEQGYVTLTAEEAAMNSGLTKAVDLNQVRRRRKREEEAQRVAAMGPEERAQYDAEQLVAKKGKQRKAKEELAALAEKSVRKTKAKKEPKPKKAW